MNETSKLIEKRKKLGYYDKYFVGKGLEIGGWNDPLIVNGKPITQHTLPDGSTHLLPFKDGEFDFLYASHVLEHFPVSITVLKEWLRVVKVGGYVYFSVPDFELYEKGKWPSVFNPAHKNNFSLIKVKAIATALSDIAYPKLCLLEDNNFDYSLDQSIDQTRGKASCQIDCCLQKLFTSSDIVCG
jgi:SAM-dependent methyltransferase